MISADPEGWYAFGPEAMGEEASADYRRAIHTSAQIVAWALVFGYAQQLFTRMVDERGQAVLAAVGGPENPTEALSATLPTTVTPAPRAAAGCRGGRVPSSVGDQRDRC